MPDFNNSEIGPAILATEFTGRSAQAYEHPLFGRPSLRVNDPLPYDPGVPEATTIEDLGQKNAAVQNDVPNAQVADEATLGLDWFEDFHVLPRSVSLDNVLSTQQIPFEVYSSHRRSDQDWLSFVNNAGAGTTMLNLPTLPFTFKPQSSGALNLILEVSTSGDPKVDGTLDFVFDMGTVEVPVTIERVVLFPLPPELPYEEFLEFLTDVLVHKDASEQRIALRKNPRQLFVWNFILEDGSERTKIHNFLFDWQSRVFGVPQWHELTSLTAAGAVDDTSITVQTTAFADYRTANGNLVLIYTDDGTFDVLPLNALTATTLTFDSPLLNSYPVGTLVCPLRTGVLGDSLRGSRFPSSDARLRLEFRVLDNDANLADTSPFNIFNGKVLLDGFNGVRGSMPEAFERRLVVVDGNVGVTETASPWDVNRRRTRKSFIADGKQGLWEVRGLLHALRGQQVSVYLPSFSDDLTPNANLTLGSNQLDVENVGYAQFVRQRPGRNIIRVTPNNGDPVILRTIVSSVVVDSTTEQLVVDSTWPATYTPSEIDRIEFVEEVRLDSDRVSMRHEIGERLTYVTVPVTAVVE